MMTWLIAGLFCVFPGVVGRAVLSVPREGGLARLRKQFCRHQGDCSWRWMITATPVNWHTPTYMYTDEIVCVGGGGYGLACESRGGHYYTYCTDTCDRDQNLIRPILGLDRLIPAGILS